MMTQTHGTRLSVLLPELALGEFAQREVVGMTLDSRQVKANNLFVALKGAQVDARKFIPDALAQGAAAVLVDTQEADEPVSLLSGCPVIAVPGLASALSDIAGRYYRHPSQDLNLLGITGTNGKTTCSLLWAQLCAYLQGRAGVVGTLGYGLLKRERPMASQLETLVHTGLTTPDAVGTQRILREMADAGAKHLAMEVSSHSLVQGRVAAVNMATALFTNLTQDHLDFHEDMDQYGAAKTLLLHQPGLRHAVVNLDDPWAAGLITQLPEAVTGLSYSLSNQAADVYLLETVEQRSGVRALIYTPWGNGELHSTLLGDFNLSNLLGVITSACACGFLLEEVLNKVPKLIPAPGRMEPVVVDEQCQDVQVVVDFAHTPDALDNTLQALQTHKTGRIWCVFGCGGDRDKDKRPVMGRIAERYSDYVIVTNDNPRTEDPAQVAAEILRGMENDHQCLVIADRAKAIDLAIQQARAGDTILVAGKGHEDYQIFAEHRISFSDRGEISQSLHRRLSKPSKREVGP